MDEFLNVQEAAAFLRRTPDNIYHLCHTGELRRFKPGGRLVLFKKSDLVEWIEKSVIESTSAKKFPKPHKP